MVSPEGIEGTVDISYLKQLNERHRSLILQQTILLKESPDFGIIYLLRFAIVRPLDRIYTLILPLREPTSDIDPNRLGPLRIIRGALPSAHLLDKHQLGITNRLDRPPHVISSFDRSGVHRRRRCWPQRALDRVGFAQNRRP